MTAPSREGPRRVRVADTFFPLPREVKRSRYVVQRYLLPLGLAAVLEILALNVDAPPWPLLLFAVTVIFAVVVAVITDFWQALSPVKPKWPQPRQTLAADAVVFVAYLTLLTALGMTLLNVDLMGRVDSADRFSTMQAACLWNLLDAVPALKIPETLNWELTHPVVGRGGGVCLVIYKALAVVPAIGLIAAIVNWRDR